MGQVEGIYDQRSSIGIALTKLRFRAQRYLSRPEKIMGLILLGVLIILVVLPLVQILIGASSFTVGDKRLVPGAIPNQLTVYH